MATSCSVCYWHLVSASLLAIGYAIADSEKCALAQIVPDGTLGAESSVVTPTNINGLPGNQIDGGAARGANLFHSFDEFSIPTGSEAFFNNALDIQNIISRVTGSSISNIDGLLRANGAANLFLLNPNGITFGSNAALSIGGSFVGSTASSLNFTDGTQFSATAPQTTPLLTVSVPIGLQYAGNPGSILNQSRATNSNGQVVGLEVLPSRTLALVGGNVRLDSGNLQALGGRVELGGVAGAGTVGLNADGNNQGFSFPDQLARADVSLTNGALVNVRASGGGSIAINAQNLNIAERSKLWAGIGSGLGSIGSVAGNIEINATRSMNLTNESLISNAVLPQGVGSGGDINITAGSLSVNDNAKLIFNTFGQGNTGNLNIIAEDTVSFDGASSNEDNTAAFSNDLVSLDGVSSLENNKTGAFSNVQFGEDEEQRAIWRQSGAVGNGGDINITAGSLFVRNGTELSARSFGQGDAGSVNINARDTVSFDWENSNEVSSAAYSTVEEGGVGKAGGINIMTGALALTNGGFLSAATVGQSEDAGSVNINARNTVTLEGVGSNGFPPSQINAFVQTGAVGNGGNINITTGSLSLIGGGQLQAFTLGQGDAGTVNINVRDTVSFDGVRNNDRDQDPQTNGYYPSAALSSVREGAVGNGGDINITTESLSVTNSAELNAETSGSGNAGSININARESVSFDGVGSNGDFSATALSSVREDGVGNGGEINITTGSLSLMNGGGLIATSEGSGAAGNIEVSASSIRLEDEALINANTVAGQGNIELSSEDLVLRRGSNITTSATSTAGGGNITIDTGVLAALEDSNISANSVNSLGGRVTINTQGIFGTEFREQLTSESDITATGGSPELSGSVEINRLDIDPTQGLVNLPTEVVDASNSIAQGCPADGENKFIITGRGGLPPNPNDPLTGDNVLTDWNTLDSDTENRSSIAPASINSTKESANNQIVEANGWEINNKGEVILTANVPTATLDIPWLPNSDCHAPEPES